MVGTTSDWKDELGRWLKPFLERLGHKARRRMCPLYVAGLIGPGERKSIQPMAERLLPGDYDQLHHFVAAGVWDAAPLETELLIQADRLVGGSDAVLVIDDTAVPKKGKHSVGVAAQYASALGKTANCQTLVSLTLARGEVPVMVALRLFLPESWTNDRVRLKRAGVPLECRTARTKPEIALAEIDRVIAVGVRIRLCAGGRWLRAERAVPPWSYRPQSCLGGRHPSSPQGVPCRRAVDLARCQTGPPATAACPRYSIDTGRRHAGRCQVANCELANRDERQAQSPLCRGPCPHRRRTTAADQGQGPAASAGRRSLAYWRTPRLRREEILSRQSACCGRPAHFGRDHQGAMDLRAGPPAAERGTRPRPLRGAILARPPPSCADDDDRIRLPSASSPQKSEAGKKNQRTAASTKLASRASRHPRTHRSTAAATLPALPKMDLRKERRK